MVIQNLSIYYLSPLIIHQEHIVWYDLVPSFVQDRFLSVVISQITFADGVTICIVILYIEFEKHKNMEGTTRKFVCIHGHFYQPPRENAWLEIIEQQDSAAPFHDWNERINFECYAPNTSARLLDYENYIIDIRNNYSRISFNFGPTLLSWLADNDRTTYQAILDADKKSIQQFSGHGNAIAQVYNHLIMPLANRKDKETQIIWGIKDFEFRFGRKPEGMWLAETAVDTETLEIMADQGLRYTILAPRQGKAVRKIGADKWETLPPDSIDPRRPYQYNLPSGKSISLFFYHGGIAQGVAFQGLLNNGEYFAQAFTNIFTDTQEPQLAHIATDGESYGHHHRHGEMALSACLRHFEQHPDIQLTNYGEFLDLHPPTWEAQIHEKSSWSCVHGVERWRSNCGCNTGGHPDWSQAWRAPLRDSLDWLRNILIPVFEREADKLVHDPWLARNAYIDVILNRSRDTIDSFLQKHSKNPNQSAAERTQILRLMELQRYAMLMYTSCGWFFDEISGIETDQILQYAARVIHFARQTAGMNLTESFVDRLRKAPSNVYPNGAYSYEQYIIPNQVNLGRMAMHYAASSLFEEYPEQLDIFNYMAHSEVLHQVKAGSQQLNMGRTIIKSKTTYSEKHFSFAVLYLGQQNMIGNVSVDMSRFDFDQMTAKLNSAFKQSNIGEVIGLMQEEFGPDKFTINQLFREEKRSFLKDISDQNLRNIEFWFRDIYNENYQLMSSHLTSNIPVPAQYLNAVQLVLNLDLKAVFSTSFARVQELKRLLDEFKKWNVDFEQQSSLAFDVGEWIYRELQQTLAEGIPKSFPRVRNLRSMLSMIASDLPFNIDSWKSQNLYYSMLKNYQRLPLDKQDKDWEQAFTALGHSLRVRIQKPKD